MDKPNHFTEEWFDEFDWFLHDNCMKWLLEYEAARWGFY